MFIAGKDEPHGLEIKEALDDYYDADINHGRLYPNLDTLVDRGLVEKGQLNRRTNKYTLTSAGQEALQDRREFEDEVMGDLRSVQTTQKRTTPYQI